jgi:hypothetical protein
MYSNIKIGNVRVSKDVKEDVVGFDVPEEREVSLCQLVAR